MATFSFQSGPVMIVRPNRKNSKYKSMDYKFEIMKFRDTDCTFINCLKIRNTSTIWEPTFVLPLEEKNLIENRDKYEESFKKKIIARIDNNIEQPIFSTKTKQKEQSLYDL